MNPPSRVASEMMARANGNNNRGASIMISGADLKTLPVGLASIVGQYQIDWGFLLAGATLASLPVIILFIFVGKYFVSGLTDGAVK